MAMMPRQASGIAHEDLRGMGVIPEARLMGRHGNDEHHLISPLPGCTLMSRHHGEKIDVAACRARPGCPA